ncbi:MAG: hypothetical protein ABGW90_04765 [Martelella sp.]
MSERYDIEFEDQGQDLLRISCNAETGEITDAGPFHRALYVDGNHFVDIDQLIDNRIVHFRKGDGDDKYFRWPMIRLSLDGRVIAEAAPVQE